MGGSTGNTAAPAPDKAPALAPSVELTLRLAQFVLEKFLTPASPPAISEIEFLINSLNATVGNINWVIGFGAAAKPESEDGAARTRDLLFAVMKAMPPRSRVSLLFAMNRTFCPRCGTLHLHAQAGSALCNPCRLNTTYHGEAY